MVEDESAALANALIKEKQRLEKGEAPYTESKPEKRINIRKSFIETDRTDPNGFERVLGISDLVSINFLDRGRLAAAAVCRIRVPSQGGEWFGTGFLVADRLLITNNHVLDSEDQAMGAEVEFEFEHDADGALRPHVDFNLKPNEVFYTNAELDFTVVGVNRYSSNGNVPIERFGRLPLIPLSGKAINGEWITICQHPGGQPKQMAIHSSRIIEITPKSVRGIDTEKFIHYTTDTEPGSSGSPVLNDQWQVVAIHHKAIPHPGQMPKTLGDGTLDYSSIRWLANEGVRISAIFKHLQGERLNNEHARRALERIEAAIGIPPLSSKPFGIGRPDLWEKDRSAFPLADWAAHAAIAPLGYDRSFLPVELELKKMIRPKLAVAAMRSDTNTPILDYMHFSAVIHKDYKFAMLTAVNINGSKLVNTGARTGGWRRDARMSDIFQPAGNFYEAGLSRDSVTFSRGHLVRRVDPCWGTEEEARIAERHTFHYTNAAPQIQRYNDVDWGNLEDYILYRAQTSERKMSVFTGPVFRDADPTYGAGRDHGPWKIPVSYWKIAAIEKPGGRIGVAAFVIGQVEYLRPLYEKKVFSRLTPYTRAELQSRHIQTTVDVLEATLGFNFRALKPYDGLAGIESDRAARIITSPSDIFI